MAADAVCHPSSCVVDGRGGEEEKANIHDRNGPRSSVARERRKATTTSQQQRRQQQEATIASHTWRQAVKKADEAVDQTLPGFRLDDICKLFIDSTLRMAILCILCSGGVY